MSALRPLGMLLPHLRRRRGLFLGVVAVVIVGMLAAVAVSVLSVSAASSLVTAGDPARAAAIALVAAVVASVVVAGLAAWSEQWFAHVLAYRVIDALRLDVHRTIARLAPVGLARRRTGDTVAAAMGDVEALEWFAAHTVAQVTAGVLACAVIDTTAAVLFGPVWLLLVPAQVALVLIPLSFVRRAGRQGEELRAALARVSARVLAARSAARDVVLLGRVDAEARAVADETGAVQRARRGLALRAGVEQACTDAMTVAVLLTTLLLVGSAVAGGADAAIAPTLVVLAAASLGPAAIAAGALARVGETAQAARRVDTVLRAPDVRPVDPVMREGAHDPGPVDPSPHDGDPTPLGAGADPRAGARHPGSIDARALTAAYPGVGSAALVDADVRVAPGEHIAVVGPSGAGKTTLALVLTRLLASRGTLRIDDVDTAAEAGADTRSRVVLVPQQPHVFRASVRDNLLAPDADDPTLWDALERARLAAHVRRLPDGLDTLLAERGATWSGGERQRLGLARALLREPSVLVLDEPTASLDTATEAEFLAALSLARAGRTTIAITHRPTLMRAMDRVLFVDGGRVADTGPHDELRARSPRYRAVVDGASQSPSAHSDPERR
ncbi:amino acid ABC transporter ATP-binding/permease protein [Microbacterium sp. VKM Ac-2923]|uniref:amino acid ABC transporter ATP-binding/permease protein n=1 Tax=Microbacterium sp. VKM Ac-2923 TaxID=2929476 RepID=UPI001FB2F704|nr:ABC transporter ATP-binding protein [Microbacterium sp. VKM Ac-2923]MCJ1709518.1 ABC transporter ATP-binding protein/permease [Microbacterium sp. VKM Ac-2923]